MATNYDELSKLDTPAKTAARKRRQRTRENDYIRNRGYSNWDDALVMAIKGIVKIPDGEYMSISRLKTMAVRGDIEIPNRPE